MFNHGATVALLNTFKSQEPAMPTLDHSTRGRIVTSARELMLERGYEGTTMRAIASRAGVSLGNAYYYFAGKEDLIQGFYLDIATEHHARVTASLADHTSFGDRLTMSLETLVDISERYAPLANSLLTLAIAPTSPLHPLSTQSRDSGALFMATCEAIIDGSSVKADARLRAVLPELLWLVHLLTTLGWVQDLSTGKAVTRRVIHRTGPTLARLISLTRLAPLRPIVGEVVKALDDLDEARPGWRASLVAARASSHE